MRTRLTRGKRPRRNPPRVGSHPRWRTSAKKRRSVARRRRGWTRASENDFDWRRIDANVSSANSPRSARDIDESWRRSNDDTGCSSRRSEGANAISATVWNANDGSYRRNLRGGDATIAGPRRPRRGDARGYSRRRRDERGGVARGEATRARKRSSPPPSTHLRAYSVVNANVIPSIAYDTRARSVRDTSRYRSFVIRRSRFARSSSSRHSPRAAHSAAPKYANVVMYDAM